MAKAKTLDQLDRIAETDESARSLPAWWTRRNEILEEDDRAVKAAGDTEQIACPGWGEGMIKAGQEAPQILRGLGYRNCEEE